MQAMALETLANLAPYVQMGMFEDHGLFVAQYLLQCVHSQDRAEIAGGVAALSRLACASANHAWLRKLGKGFPAANQAAHRLPHRVRAGLTLRGLAAQIQASSGLW